MAGCKFDGLTLETEDGINVVPRDALLPPLLADAEMVCRICLLEVGVGICPKGLEPKPYYHQTDWTIALVPAEQIN